MSMFETTGKSRGQARRKAGTREKLERLGRALLHHQENGSSGLHMVYARNQT